MKKLMNVLMLSCKKASALIDKKAETKLSIKENIQLHLHTSMCDACTAYMKQSKMISDALHKHLHNHEDEVTPLINNKGLQNKIISDL
jgi:anti-sigma factor RsiW